MTPQPSTIAHYRLSAKLGEGGMGAVYRATDFKLNRRVTSLAVQQSHDTERIVGNSNTAMAMCGLQALSVNIGSLPAGINLPHSR